MGKGRYIIGILVGVVGIAVGIFLSIYYDEWSNFPPAYAIGAFLANLIWFDGPVLFVAKFGIGICATVFSFFFGTGIGCLLLLFAPVAITICAGVLTLTLVGVAVTSFVMFPINIFRFAHDLY